MKTHNINLNIHYSAPDEVWEKIELIYAKMPYWNGFVDGLPQWFGTDGKIIEVSVEPSGLQFYGELSDEEWDNWILQFKNEATNELGYEIGEPEDGFEFPYYDIYKI